MTSAELISVAIVPACAAGRCSACPSTDEYVAEVLLGDPRRTAVGIRLCKACAAELSAQLARQFKKGPKHAKNSD